MCVISNRCRGPGLKSGFRHVIKLPGTSGWVFAFFECLVFTHSEQLALQDLASISV